MAAAFVIVLAPSRLAADVATDHALATSEIPARGVVKALHQASLTAQINAQIEVIGFREGQRFQAGDLLVAFDCRRQKHELSALDAAMREAHVAVVSNQHLIRSGASNRTDVAVAAARYDKAKAEKQAMEEILGNCNLVAPFSGIVTELTVNAHEMPLPNRPLMTIVDVHNLEIEIIAPSRLLAALQRGASFRFVIDETRRSYPAKVVRTGGAIDPMSQTVKFYAEFSGATDDVLPGMSGVADVAMPNLADTPAQDLP